MTNQSNLGSKVSALEGIARLADRSTMEGSEANVPTSFWLWLSNPCVVPRSSVSTWKR